MKAIVSSTYHDQYFFYLPITAWLWQKLGVEIICFLPVPFGDDPIEREKRVLVSTTLKKHIEDGEWKFFEAPLHKQATYAQCARNYSGCLNLPTEELTIVSDIDMGVFKIPDHQPGTFSVFGNDLVPSEQYPMCYLTASHIDWWEAMECGDKTYQECLDGLLKHIECESFRGNYWGKDQEEAYNKISKVSNLALIERARPGTQFASHRIDRDDSFFMDRLSPDTIDYHFHRPGYTDENFEKIISVIKYFYPNDDLTWMNQYQQSYKKLTNE